MIKDRSIQHKNTVLMIMGNKNLWNDLKDNQRPWISENCCCSILLNLLDRFVSYDDLWFIHTRAGVAPPQLLLGIVGPAIDQQEASRVILTVSRVILTFMEAFIGDRQNACLIGRMLVADYQAGGRYKDKENKDM